MEEENEKKLLEWLKRREDDTIKKIINSNPSVDVSILAEPLISSMLEIKTSINRISNDVSSMQYDLRELKEIAGSIKIDLKIFLAIFGIVMGSIAVALLKMAFL